MVLLCAVFGVRCHEISLQLLMYGEMAINSRHRYVHTYVYVHVHRYMFGVITVWITYCHCMCNFVTCICCLVRQCKLYVVPLLDLRYWELGCIRL